MQLTPDGCTIKATPEDFVVHETNAFPLGRSGDFAYAMLIKRGLTTWQAIDGLAQQLGLPAADIGYGGLKDEDAVTCQTISVPAAALARLRQIENARFDAAGGRAWWELRVCGRGAEPMRTGVVAANAFRIVVRDVPTATLARFHAGQRIEHAFLNFYGPQRFCRPGKRPLAPDIGEAIARQDWRAAADLLDDQEYPDARKLPPQVDEQALLGVIGERARDFFLSSHESRRWNEKLLRLCVPPAPGGDTLDTIQRVYAQARSLPYERFYGPRTAGERATIVHAQIFVLRSALPDAHAGTAGGTLELSFLLPSGAYATTCLTQLLAADGVRAADAAPDDGRR